MPRAVAHLVTAALLAAALLAVALRAVALRAVALRTVALRAVALLAVALTVTGCGFVATGNAPAGKPDLFRLHGYVSVRAAEVHGSPGTGCEAPPAVRDIRVGGPVRVADSDGRTLGAGQLGPGVLSTGPDGARCNFPFEVIGVQGGVDRYVIGVGSRPTTTFAAQDLRENKQAVITVEG